MEDAWDNQRTTGQSIVDIPFSHTLCKELGLYLFWDFSIFAFDLLLRFNLNLLEIRDNLFSIRTKRGLLEPMIIIIPILKRMSEHW